MLLPGEAFVFTSQFLPLLAIWGWLLLIVLLHTVASHVVIVGMALQTQGWAALNPVLMSSFALARLN